MPTSAQIGETKLLTTPGGTVRVESFDRVGVDRLYANSLRAIASARRVNGADVSTRLDLSLRRHIVYPAERV